MWCKIQEKTCKEEKKAKAATAHTTTDEQTPSASQQEKSGLVLFMLKHYNL